MSRSGVSRRAVLTVLPAAALAGCARPPIVITSPTARPAGSVGERFAQIMEAYAATTRNLGVAVRDLRDGTDLDFNAGYASQSASMAKVMIVAMALRRARAEGGELSFEQLGWASRAVTVSDNDSADALWEYAGGPDAYTALASDLELPDTHADPRSTFWSWTWTTPADQRLLLRRLLEGTPVLTDPDRLYLLDLMGRVDASQRWGVGHPTRQDATASDVKARMKNGWVEFRSTDGLWAVNSMGYVKGAGREYAAALMCRVESFEKGRRLLDAIGGELFGLLG